MNSKKVWDLPEHLQELFEAAGLDALLVLSDDPAQIDQLREDKDRAASLLSVLDSRIGDWRNLEVLRGAVERAASCTYADPLEPACFSEFDLDLAKLKQLDQAELERLRDVGLDLEHCGMTEEDVTVFLRLADELETLTNSAEPEPLGAVICEHIINGKRHFIPVIGIDNCVLVDLGSAGDEWLERRGVGRSGTGPEGSDYSPEHIDGLSFADIVAAAEQGDPVRPNLVYFHKPHYTFHPGEEPREDLAGVQPAPQRPALAHISNLGKPKRVLSLDTGFLNQHDDLHCHVDYANNADIFENDQDEITRGHGPAIADLIGEMIGDNQRSKLQTIPYDEGCLKALMTVEHGETLQNQTAKRVRCFDELALDLALSRLDPNEFDILNLSLGTMSCPDLMFERDPIYRRLAMFVAQGKQIVVAAGNHEDERWSYPASYSRDFSEIHSASSNRGNFAAKSSTITDYVNGQNVEVAFRRNTNRASWSGTSFAAPQVAARLATQ